MHVYGGGGGTPCDIGVGGGGTPLFMYVQLVLGHVMLGHVMLGHVMLHVCVCIFRMALG